jgi:hypothetical protein
LPNRSGNGGLPGIEEHGRFAHASGLHDGHQDVEVLQLQPAPDAITQLHFGTYDRAVMAISKHSIMPA